ncbi:MAG: OmpA family protein [Planctomycetes bacterium]|nr:OmpA family protein [Planctomycetota bacterium]
MFRSSCLTLALCGLLSACGCAPFVSHSQLTAAQTQCRRLNEQVMAQQGEIAGLNTHRREVEDNLIKSERELAALDKQNQAHLAQLANYEREREQLYSRLGVRGGALPAGVGAQLAELAKRFPQLHFDPQTGLSKLDTDVLFATGDAELRPEARDMLTQFAGILRSKDAAGLRLMVVGHTDNERIVGPEVRQEYPNNWHLSAGRALKVADFLRACGVPESRMGVAGYGQYQPLVANNSSGSRQENRRVELFLIAPEVPVVGWTETVTSVYR